MRHRTPVEPAWPLSVEDLPATVLDEVRSGPVRDAWGIRSAYDKRPLEGRVAVTPLGIAGDEQASDVHGGPDRALLQYSSDHLATWREQLPGRADEFVPGAFGENLVAAGWDEWTMCVGDVVRVGSCLLQVAQTRSPCYKLNHHFDVPTMSRIVQASGRSGWLYRVLEPGHLQAGDEMRVVERPHPDWPLARLQHHLYDAPFDAGVAKELSALPALAASAREKFAQRLRTGAVEGFAARLGVPDDGPARTWRLVRVAAVDHPSPRLVRLTLTADDLPRWKAGAHITIQAGNGAWRNDYSLCGPAGGDWQVVIARGEGGSRFLADHTAVGDVLRVSDPVNHFPVHRRATRHLFLAGGVGATALLPMAQQLGHDADWHLHLAVRDDADAAILGGLAGEFGDRVTVWHSRGASGRMDLAAMLAEPDEGTHLYACGSGSFLAAVRDASAHWPHKQVHFEAFQAVEAGQEPFTATVAQTGETLDVPAGTSLLQALREAGHEVASDCETGSCAMCVVGVVDGEVLHRDLVLSDAQRASEMCSCVSRGIGHLTISLPAR